MKTDRRALREGPPFEAKWAGTCAADECGRAFPAGAMVRFDKHDKIVHVDCSDAEEVFRGEASLHYEEPEDYRVPKRLVLPRNPRSACTRCFQIPSANGVCGCL